MNNGYQGWNNYPTWAVALWVDNEEGLYERFLRMARESEGDVYELANLIKDEVEDWAIDLDIDPSPLSDILSWAIEQVDWRELADHYWEAAREE